MPPLAIPALYLAIPALYLAIPALYLVIPAKAGIQRIKRALRAPSGRSEGAADSDNLAPPPAGANVRMCAYPRSICAGFPPLFKPGASSAREWRIFSVPVGSFSGGSGFSEFLHGLTGRNPSFAGLQTLGGLPFRVIPNPHLFYCLCALVTKTATYYRKRERSYRLAICSHTAF